MSSGRRGSPGPPLLRNPAPRLLELDTLWIVVAVGLPAIVALAGEIGMIDLAYHLRAGSMTLGGGEIVRGDPFSFASTEGVWVNQQWGAQILLATTFRLGGFEALALLRSGFIVLTLSFTFLACRARGASTRTSALLTAGGGALLLPALAIRPQLFGVLLMAMTLWVAATEKDHPRRIWLLPAFAVVWANTHGSFVLLPLVIALLLVEGVAERRSISRVLAAGLIACAAIVVNPFGVQVWGYALDIISSPVIRETITEWAPPRPSTLVGALFFGSVLGVGALLARLPRPAPWPTLLWIVAFLLPAIAASRSIAWWALALPPTLAVLLPGSSEQASHGGSRLLNGLFLAALGSSAIFLWPSGGQPTLTDQPVELARAVGAEVPTGTRLFVPQTWASWFEFALPSHPVLVDSRIELYSPSVWADYTAVVSGRADWSDLLDRWGVEVIVTERGWDVVPFIEADARWRRSAVTPSGAVFVRE